MPLVGAVEFRVAFDLVSPDCSVGDIGVRQEGRHVGSSAGGEVFLSQVGYGTVSDVAPREDGREGEGAEGEVGEKDTGYVAAF